MPVVSQPTIRALVHTSSTCVFAGKQTFDSQEVPQRGAEIWWIVQHEGPLSRESPMSSPRVLTSVSELNAVPSFR